MCRLKDHIQDRERLLIEFIFFLGHFVIIYDNFFHSFEEDAIPDQSGIGGITPDASISNILPEPHAKVPPVQRITAGP